jgi:3-deoxy-D-manno-octulosonic-acid transferase
VSAGDLLLRVWVGLTRIAAPFAPSIVRARLRAGKEDPARWRERLGHPGVDPGAPRPTVWVHAASVGESVAVMPLVARIAASGVRVVLTTVTTTSAAVVAARLPAGVVHQFVPVDVAPCVDRFLDAWRPGLAVLVESEIWPVAIARLSDRGIPLVVSNARMSDRSFRGWSRFAGIARALFGRIDLCLAQGATDADRFRALGARRVVDVGNVKYDAAVPEAEAAAAAALEGAVGDRPVMLAASTHPGEDGAVLDAFATARAEIAGLLLVVAPRHPDRGPAVAAESAGRGYAVRRRAAGELPDAGTDVYVSDTIGELGTLYRLAGVAFVGGSLVAVGGHNPVEPARLGVPVVSGRDVSSFRDAYAALAAEDGVALVDGPAALAAEVVALLTDAPARERRIAAAGRVVARHSGALDRTLTEIRPMLDALARPAGGDR